MIRTPWIALLLCLVVSACHDADQAPPSIDARSVTERLLDEQRARRAPDTAGEMAGLEAGKVFEHYEKTIAP